MWGESLERIVFEEVCESIKKEGKLTDVGFAKLLRVFSDRFKNALEILEDGRVRKYIFFPSGRVVWAVVGKKREYQVLSLVNFCSCNDFYFRVMDREVHLCYHLIAQKLAEALKKYDLVQERDELFYSLMEEWKKVTP